MKNIFRSFKSIPYFCLALSIILCSLMMPTPASAASPLGGSSDGYYSFDFVPPGLPSGPLPDFVSSAPSDCIIVQYYKGTGTLLFTILYVAETPGSMSVSLSDNSYSLSGRYYSSSYNRSSNSWNSPSLHTQDSGAAVLSSFVCVVTPSLLSSSTNPNFTVSSVTYHAPPTGVLDVAGGVGSWLAGALGNSFEMFYADGALTFLGYLAIAALAFSLIFLIIGLVSRFLKFGG